MSGTTSSKAFRSRSWTSQSTEKERKDITNLSKSGTSLVSGCSRLGQTWTPPWAVTSPTETRRSRTFCNDEDDGAENVDQFRFLGSWPPSYRSLPNIRNWKMNWRPSKLYRVICQMRAISPGIEFFKKDFIQVQNQKGKIVLVCSHPPRLKHCLRRFHVTVVQRMSKKCI